MIISVDESISCSQRTRVLRSRLEAVESDYQLHVPYSLFPVVMEHVCTDYYYAQQYVYICAEGGNLKFLAKKGCARRRVPGANERGARYQLV